MKSKELLEKRATLWNTMKDFLDSRRDDRGFLSAEDTATYERMEADMTNYTKEIEREQRLEALENQLKQPIRDNIVGAVTTGNAKEQKNVRATDEYNKEFWDVMKAHVGSPVVVNALQIGTDSEGGYLVPDEFERKLIEALQEECVFRTLATTIKTSSGDRKIPIVTDDGEASWLDEEGSYAESDPTFGQATIGAFKLGKIVKASEELVYDAAFDIESYLYRSFARVFGRKEEDGFVNGNGSGKPAGILDATYGGQVGVTAASATAIKADEIFDLFYSLKAPYRKNGTFLINDAIVAKIRKLKDGAGNYLWQPSLQLGQPDILLGRPVKTSAFMPDELESAAKTVAFGDFSYYWIADRQTRQMRRLNELYAATGQIGFQCMQRVDGKLILPEAIKLLKQA